MQGITTLFTLQPCCSYVMFMVESPETSRSASYGVVSQLDFIYILYDDVSCKEAQQSSGDSLMSKPKVTVVRKDSPLARISLRCIARTASLAKPFFSCFLDLHEC